MKIFIVKGSSGKYDDFEEWEVASYTSKDEAEKHLAALVERGGEIREVRREVVWGTGKTAAFNMFSEEIRQKILTNEEDLYTRASYSSINDDDAEYSITEIEPLDKYTPQTKV